MAAGNGRSNDSGSRRGGKSKAAFRTISEVADELDVAQHVLRFWETKFHQIRPLKRGGGRRYYRPEDIEFLRKIKRLLYTDGYTIKGVQRLIRQGGVAALQDVEAAADNVAATTDAVTSADTPDQRAALEKAIAELEACRQLLAGRA
ncbi:MAG: MerR family transcriptional regulator [Rhodospirillaceae bacterium]|nr:MerR family transcriptional regulator [Rhodospirillaceae bacterium]|tara:strand:- start:3508 stop:3948 length:441 start_codon:yes stop_codon:yes gene_type:complete